MINAFRKHLLREVIENLFYDLVRLWGIVGKNVDRYEEGQKEKIRGIIRELNRSERTAFSEDGEGIQERAKAVRAYIAMKLEWTEGTGESLSRKTLKTYRKNLKECVKKLNT
jgi:hypothetical protein